MLLWCIVASLLCVFVTPRVQCRAGDDVTVKEDEYGVLGNQTVKRFTFFNRDMMVQIITYGGRISAIKVPDERGRVQDIVLGFDNLEGS
jgi:aldose 1-epimerase